MSHKCNYFTPRREERQEEWDEVVLFMATQTACLNGVVNRAFSARLSFVGMDPGLSAWADMSDAVGRRDTGASSKIHTPVIRQNGISRKDA